jgi:hypothetical protein
MYNLEPEVRLQPYIFRKFMDLVSVEIFLLHEIVICPPV